LQGINAVMPAIIRDKKSKKYKWTVEEAPLSKVANVEKFMPRDFITKDGFGITDKCRAYLQPLIQGESYPTYKNGVPVYAKLKKIMVKKKLKKTFPV
jgi:6-phosphofructokinase 1